jgi:hypothetical protein
MEEIKGFIDDQKKELLYDMVGIVLNNIFIEYQCFGVNTLRSRRTGISRLFFVSFYDYLFANGTTSLLSEPR